MGHFANKVAVVTGAGSGIGRALAVELTKRGAKLAISDVDGVGLAETAALVEQAGQAPHVETLDVSGREEVYAYAERIREHFGVVHQVYNNAGIAYSGTIAEMDDKSLDRVMDVDFYGVTNGTKAFLPHLIESGDGHVINVSSVFGLFAVPTQSAYNAAKFAVRGYTESLAMEMKAAGHPVRVTCVHPGGIKTNIVRNATEADGRDHDLLAKRFEKIARTSPEKAAQVILRGVEKGKVRVLIGADAQAIDRVVRVLGPRYQFLVRRLAGSQGL